MRREPQVLRRGHRDIGDDPAFQAAHPVGQHRAGHPAQGLEALGEHRQGRLRALIAANRTNRTLDQASTAQNTWRSPSPPQSITRCSPGTTLPGRTPAMLAPERPCATATARRRLRAEPSYPAARAAGEEQALGADPALGLPHALGDQGAERIGRLGTLGGRSTGGRPPAACPTKAQADGLGSRPAQARGTPPIAAELAVRGQDVQLVPR